MCVWTVVPVHMYCPYCPIIVHIVHIGKYLGQTYLSFSLHLILLRLSLSLPSSISHKYFWCGRPLAFFFSLLFFSSFSLRPSFHFSLSHHLTLSFLPITPLFGPFLSFNETNFHTYTLSLFHLHQLHPQHTLLQTSQWSSSSLPPSPSSS